MTRTKKQILPALHNSGKVSDPDLPDIGEKNYTATILKYTNLALQFPQLKTDAKQVVPAINECRVIANPVPLGAILETESGEPIQAENGSVLELDGDYSSEDSGSVDAETLQTIQIKDIVYSVGGGSGGTTDYNNLYNLPQIDGITLKDNISSSSLSISYDNLYNKPKINGNTVESYNTTESLGIWHESVAKPLAAGDVSVSFLMWDVTQTSTIQVFTYSGINYNSISIDSYTVTVYFDAQPNDEWVKVRIS